MFNASGKGASGEADELAEVIDNEYKLLVVDDTDSIHEILDLCLPDYFSHIVHAYSGEESLAIFPDLKPDCVLMDINMSREAMSGFQATNKIRKYEMKNGIYVPTPGRAVILMHSTEARDLYLDAALAVGANDYVEKGTSPQKIHGTFLKYLNK